MSTASHLHFFNWEILHPETEAVVDVEVAYSMRDCGVMGRHNESVRAVLDSVRCADGTNIIPTLDAEAIGLLERQAQDFFADDMESSRFGEEDV